jgi:hypothetical protein
MKKRLERFIIDLKRRKIQGAYNVAVETAEIMYIGVSMGNGHAKQMMEVVRAIGDQLIFASPLDLSIGNVMRRVLFIIREEYEEFASQMQVAPQRSMLSESLSMSLSMFAIEDEEEEDAKTYSEPYNIRAPVLEAIRHFVDDLGEIHSSISQQALEHIHEHEVVLTFGKSNTVLEFLKLRTLIFFVSFVCDCLFLKSCCSQASFQCDWRLLRLWRAAKRPLLSAAKASPSPLPPTAPSSPSCRESTRQKLLFCFVCVASFVFLFAFLFVSHCCVFFVR